MSKRKFIIMVLMMFLSLIGSPVVDAASVELVINGSFEEPLVTLPPWWDYFHSSQIPGWTVENALTSAPDFLEFWFMPSWATDGNQCVELDTTHNVKIYQDIPTNPGSTYKVKWTWIEREPGCQNLLEVWWNGALMETLQAEVYETKYSEERTWTASGTSTRLMFIQGGPSSSYGNVLDAVSVTEVILVEIDIKPGSDTNSINPNANGVIPIAILTTADFDASTIDPQTVALEGANAKGKGNSGKYGSMEDIDGDGDLDLVIHVENKIEWAENTIEATLTGMTWDGIAIEGTDSVNIVPPVK